MGAPVPARPKRQAQRRGRRGRCPDFSRPCRVARDRLSRHIGRAPPEGAYRVVREIGQRWRNPIPRSERMPELMQRRRVSRVARSALPRASAAGFATWIRGDIPLSSVSEKGERIMRFITDDRVVARAVEQMRAATTRGLTTLRRGDPAPAAGRPRPTTASLG